MNKKILTAIMSLALAAGTMVCAADDGEALYNSKTCAVCHGVNGKTLMPIYPKLTGQNKDYLLQQMKDIKSGARNNGMSSTMQPSLQEISEAEMKAIAEWLSSLQ